MMVRGVQIHKRLLFAHGTRVVCEHCGLSPSHLVHAIFLVLSQSIHNLKFAILAICKCQFRGMKYIQASSPSTSRTFLSALTGSPSQDTPAPRAPPPMYFLSLWI